MSHYQEWVILEKNKSKNEKKHPIMFISFTYEIFKKDLLFKKMLLKFFFSCLIIMILIISLISLNVLFLELSRHLELPQVYDSIRREFISTQDLPTLLTFDPI